MATEDTIVQQAAEQITMSFYSTLRELISSRIAYMKKQMTSIACTTMEFFWNLLVRDVLIIYIEHPS